MQHLDVAGGTGDIGLRVLRAIRAAEAERGNAVEPGRVTVSDINADMLEAGKRDVHAKWKRLGRGSSYLCEVTDAHLDFGRDYWGKSGLCFIL